MFNSRSLGLYEDGLKTLLDLCEQCFGPNGTPIFIKSTESEKTIPTKNSMDILKTIHSYSDNPLVKVTLHFALEQSNEYGDHTFYMIILALNLYLKLKRENVCHKKLLEKITELENLIEKEMVEPNRFHRRFENHFDFLVQLSMSIIKPKLFGYSLSKLESFCRFVVAAILQSIPAKNDQSSGKWFKPAVITIPTITPDPYKYGEIFEGFLFPINGRSKVKTYLQRVIELRSFITYELLYKERRNLNSILMVYDSSKTCESLHEQMEINAKNCLPSIKQTIIDVFEGDFIGLLERSNVGLIIVQNEMSGNFRSKLSDRSIFLLDGIDGNLISRTSQIFNVEVVTSLKIEDTESFVFQVEIPNLRHYRNTSYLAIPKPGIITVIFYKLLDSNNCLNEYLSNILFKLLSKMIFDQSQYSSTNLCHGAGCIEFLIAGVILRAGENDKVSTNFWMPKANYNHSYIQTAMSESFIRIWELTRDPVNESQICDQWDKLLATCQNNFSCVCGLLRQSMDSHNNIISDFTAIKIAAIKNALRLVSVLMSTDFVILTTN